jgi:hypothetical protein
MQAGLSLAQIGEFSFLIASLGSSLKATSDFLYPIVVAVSAVTTFTTPYMIKFSGPIADRLERHLPTGSPQTHATVRSRNDKRFWRKQIHASFEGVRSEGGFKQRGGFGCFVTFQSTIASQEL